MVDDALGGERRRHAFVDQLDDLEHAVPITGARLDAVAGADRRGRLRRTVVDADVAALARVRRQRARSVYPDRPQPHVDAHLVDRPSLAAAAGVPGCDTAGMRLDSDRSYRFPVSPDVLWSAIAHTAEYRTWWPWLTALDADGLAAGEVWRCTVRPPLPYRLRFAIHLDQVEPTTLIAARLSGDIGGSARLDVTPEGAGCAVRLRSSLAPNGTAFGWMARLAGPLARRGHDWVLDAGARQFVAAVDDR